jgi:hypothetical protein
MSDQHDDLLKVPDIDAMDNAPLKEIVKSLYYQVIQSQVIELELRNEVNKLTGQVDRLNEILGEKTFIRTRWISLSYDKRLSELTLAKKYIISFANTSEADLLETMFFVKSRKPRSTKWQCKEAADKFRAKNYDQLDTPRKVYKTLLRIRDRLRAETKTDLLKVTTTEFYWFDPH